MIWFAAALLVRPDALILLTDNLPVLWPQVSEATRRRTVITVLRELLAEGRAAGLVGDADPELQMTLVVGTLGQLARQVYLGGLDGPASRYLGEVGRLLRKGLA